VEEIELNVTEKLVVAPDFTSDAPADWKPSGQYGGVIFLGRVLNPVGKQVFPGEARFAMRLLKQTPVEIITEYAFRNGYEPNLCKGVAMPMAENFINAVVPCEAREEIFKESVKADSSVKVMLAWTSWNNSLCGAINCLQPEHRSRWVFLGRPDKDHAVWVLRYNG